MGAMQALQSLGPKLRNQPQGGGPQGSRPTAPPPATDHTGLVPLDQMTEKDTYKGENGGLYGDGKNVPPPEHQKAVQRELARIVPLGPDGKPSPDGKVVLISIGMSNTMAEFSRFKELADRDPAKSSRLVIVDGAQGGQDAERWSAAEMPAWATLEQAAAAGGSHAPAGPGGLDQARRGRDRPASASIPSTPRN